jgi:hypothetical protein
MPQLNALGQSLTRLIWCHHMSAALLHAFVSG